MSEEDSLVDVDDALFVDVDVDSEGDGAELSLQDQAREKGASEKEVRALRRDVARLRIESLPTFTQRASTETLISLWSLAVHREEDWGEAEPAFHTARVRLAAVLYDRSGVDVDQTTPTV
ncbi:MAG: hypothetical protein L0J79_02975, partial [Propionibacterium sp.]|nr:hypothetical protein [Propionibacterium sp.]